MGIRTFGDFKCSKHDVLDGREHCKNEFLRKIKLKTHCSRSFRKVKMGNKYRFLWGGAAPILYATNLGKVRKLIEI